MVIVKNFFISFPFFAIVVRKKRKKTKKPHLFRSVSNTELSKVTKSQVVIIKQVMADALQKKMGITEVKKGGWLGHFSLVTKLGLR